jgi:hypothetical protein
MRSKLRRFLRDRGLASPRRPHYRCSPDWGRGRHRLRLSSFREGWCSAALNACLIGVLLRQRLFRRRPHFFLRLFPVVHNDAGRYSFPGRQSRTCPHLRRPLTRAAFFAAGRLSPTRNVVHRRARRPLRMHGLVLTDAIPTGATVEADYSEAA